MSTMEKVRKRISVVPLGQPFAAGMLAVCGEQKEVIRTLRKLTKSEEILRVAHGVYVKPRHSLGFGIVRPGALEVAQALAEEEGARLAIHGAAWALKFGLTTRVMTSPTFLTDGRTQRVRTGKVLFTLRHASPEEMRLSETQAGRAILALRWLGQPAAPQAAVGKVLLQLPETEFARFLGLTLSTDGWITKTLKALVKPEGGTPDPSSIPRYEAESILNDC